MSTQAKRRHISSVLLKLRFIIWYGVMIYRTSCCVLILLIEILPMKPNKCSYAFRMTCPINYCIVHILKNYDML